jgi:hypothetical protein
MSEVTSDSSSSDEEILQDDELGSFLLEALSGFDPQADEAVELVAL